MRFMSAYWGPCLAACLLAACSAGPVGNLSVPQPARSVDLNRYLGRWYEIARYDNSFEKGCEGVTADYAKGADGSIDVVNTCRHGNPDGQTETAEGRAETVQGSGDAKLRVSFFWPFYGDYWVLDRADDYAWSIVGEPSGRYLWILTRHPLLAKECSQSLVSRAAALGYDTSLLRFTRQPPAGTPADPAPMACRASP